MPKTGHKTRQSLRRIHIEKVALRLQIRKAAQQFHQLDEDSLIR